MKVKNVTLKLTPAGDQWTVKVKCDVVFDTDELSITHHLKVALLRQWVPGYYGRHDKVLYNFSWFIHVPMHSYHTDSYTLSGSHTDLEFERTIDGELLETADFPTPDKIRARVMVHSVPALGYSDEEKFQATTNLELPPDGPEIPGLPK